MRNSRRIKRMGRNRLKISKMDLTSLMDVFTILGCGWVMNSGSVDVLDSPMDLTLPESCVETKPRETKTYEAILRCRIMILAEEK